MRWRSRTGEVDDETEQAAGCPGLRLYGLLKIKLKTDIFAGMEVDAFGPPMILVIAYTDFVSIYVSA